MPDGIGLVQFFQTIIGYIALCTALGIPIYAVREIARIKDNQIECNKITYGKLQHSRTKQSKATQSKVK